MIICGRPPERPDRRSFLTNRLSQSPNIGPKRNSKVKSTLECNPPNKKCQSLLAKKVRFPIFSTHVWYCNFAMRKPILKILGALERGHVDDSNAPKNFKIGSHNAKWQHETWCYAPLDIQVIQATRGLDLELPSSLWAVIGHTAN